MVAALEYAREQNTIMSNKSRIGSTKGPKKGTSTISSSRDTRRRSFPLAGQQQQRDTKNHESDDDRNTLSPSRHQRPCRSLPTSPTHSRSALRSLVTIQEGSQQAPVILTTTLPFDHSPQQMRRSHQRTSSMPNDLNKVNLSPTLVRPTHRQIAANALRENLRLCPNVASSPSTLSLHHLRGLSHGYSTGNSATTSSTESLRSMSPLPRTADTSQRVVERGALEELDGIRDSPSQNRRATQIVYDNNIKLQDKFDAFTRSSSQHSEEQEDMPHLEL